MENSRTFEVGVYQGKGDDGASDGIIEEKEEMVDVIPGSNLIEKTAENEGAGAAEERPQANLEHDREYYVAFAQDTAKSPCI